MNRRCFMGLVLPAVLLALLAAVNLFAGSLTLPATEVWNALTRQSDAGATATFIVRETRLPALLTAAVAGAALSVAGLVMQTVFANPLADPSVLGVNAGASLGAAVAMLLLGGTVATGGMVLSGFALTVASAFAGALGVIVLLTLCSALLPDRLMLLIAGVMLSFLTSAFISILNFYATTQGVHAFTIWGLGDFSGVGTERLAVFSAAAGAGLLAALLLTKPLDALLLGEAYAAGVGIRVRRVRTLLLLTTGWLSAVVTAVCGPLSFIGLAVPHAARLALHTGSHRRLLPATMLWGADAALACNALSHLPGTHGTLPLNAITPLFGVPVVMWLLFRGRHRV